MELSILQWIMCVVLSNTTLSYVISFVSGSVSAPIGFVRTRALVPEHSYFATLFYNVARHHHILFVP